MGTSVTSVGIISLRKTSKLKNLNLVNTQVSDSVVEQLASFPNLQNLFLWNSNFTAKGVNLLRSKKTNAEINF
jgi:hypothetical protein